MKSTTIRRTITGPGLLAAAYALQPEEWAWITLAKSVPAARAAEGPRLIEIKTKKLEFTPSEITLKRANQ